jgi:hypothetical protein
VVDIGEFQSDHGNDRPAGIANWADVAPGDKLVFHSLRLTDPSRSWDGDVEYTGTLKISR